MLPNHITFLIKRTNLVTTGVYIKDNDRDLSQAIQQRIYINRKLEIRKRLFIYVYL